MIQQIILHRGVRTEQITAVIPAIIASLSSTGDKIAP